MKKILPLILLVICLALVLVACGEETTTEPAVTTTKASGVVETPADTTTAITPTTQTPTTQTPGVSTPAIDPDLEPIVTEDYTAIPNKFEWTASGEVDYSKFDYSGTGAKVVSTLDGKYNGWSKSWYQVD